MGDDGPTIEVVTPQFERRDGREPRPAPASREDFEALRDAPDEELLELGCQKWEEDLWLLPHEWHEDIPEGFEMETINGETEVWESGGPTPDKRFGVLAFGIRNG